MVGILEPILGQDWRTILSILLFKTFWEGSSWYASSLGLHWGGKFDVQAYPSWWWVR